MNKLDKHIRDHYAGKSLSDDRLEAILKQGKKRTNWTRRLPLWAAAALFLIGIFSLNTYWERHQLNQRVLAEIAMNHNKRLSVEVSSNQYADVQQGLDRLEFAILPLDLTVIENHELLGGRYCSIQGHLAAQLKLKHKKTGNVKTLYVTRLTESLSDVHTQTTTTSGVTIRLWKTGSRLFGLAHDMP